jgi:hypothetical protein
MASASCCDCGDEPSGSCATELVTWLQVSHVHKLIILVICKFRKKLQIQICHILR